MFQLKINFKVCLSFILKIFCNESHQCISLAKLSFYSILQSSKYNNSHDNLYRFSRFQLKPILTKHPIFYLIINIVEFFLSIFGFLVYFYLWFYLDQIYCLLFSCFYFAFCALLHLLTFHQLFQTKNLKIHSLLQYVN